MPETSIQQRYLLRAPNGLFHEVAATLADYRIFVFTGGRGI